MWGSWIDEYDPNVILRQPRKPARRIKPFHRLRTASKFSACLGIGLFIASLPSESILGIIGAAALVAIGTVGCIETEE